MKKKFLVILAFGIGVCFLSMNAFAEDNSAPAPNPVQTDVVSEKLDKVIQTQDQILKELDDIKAELQIVKIRASQR
jgi:hypothetical protein